MDCDAFRLDLSIGRGDPEKLARVDSATADVAHHEVALGDLHGDLVAARGRSPKDLARLLHPRPIWRHSRKRWAMGHEVLGEVLVQDGPVTGLVGVNRLDVPLNEGLVLLRRHLRLPQFD
jgi:hypothetical protein